ncbi:cob(I)yrinic acid a,c-diamide adenosyltransferase [Aromatoleum anaerobium]|uniref:Corrinoid adenosyltransferase n=1 Tax=Aromatoleum anaerobium TaxID=182180 RepID=A0ABX1PNK4_9RHOO|nr:cob(I)yrinic acid a,c-diamide adenosyltransferase [Aromatoleum anaerobium]MCK0506508.1 cob(I)yrinic acid a,c-diamide adenosyltransferase [Aromatoleum anaerobium]
MDEADQRHRQRMARKKQVIDARIAAAQGARGVVVLHTGNGKGKSSAAFGVLARALGHGQRAAVVQFVKARSDTGEEEFFRVHPQVRWHVMGEGFTWETQDKARDAVAAQAAWAQARVYLADPVIDLLILDEITYAFKYGWLDLDAVIAALKDRPPMQHVILTGRAAPPALVAAADTVSEIAAVKHAFQAGVPAMPGLEF